MTASPSITVDSPTGVPDAVSTAGAAATTVNKTTDGSGGGGSGRVDSPPRSRSSSDAAPDGSSNPRSRSMSPRTARPPPALMKAQNRSVSRPSPVVPSPSVPGSPASFSRPTSPRPTAHRHGHSNEEPTSPIRDRHHDLHAPSAVNAISRTNSGLDLTHIFERDVEFNATHHISPQEAVDVAVAPVLDEAVVALSSPAMTPDVASLVHDSEEAALNGSGWSSPVRASSAYSHSNSHAGAGVGFGPRSPVRGSQVRSFSPDSTSDGARGASPGSSTRFSIGTPPDERSHLAPFSQHLSDALEHEANKRHPSTSSDPNAMTTPSPMPSNKLVAAVPFAPTTTMGLDTGTASQVSPSPSFNALTGVVSDDRRRLSFVSYADVINEERLAELTGAPAGGEPSESTVDLATVLNRLELGNTEHH